MHTDTDQKIKTSRRNNVFIGRTNRSGYVCLLSLMGLLYGCASIPAEDDIANSEKINQPAAYKVNIINASNTTINDIRYKPCNSLSSEYQQLTNNLRPMEKFTINIYSQCVDFMARNAFKKKLVDVKNVDLQSVKTWTIR